MANPADWLGLVIFLLSGTMVAWVTEALHCARARAAAAETQALLAAEREAAAEALRVSEAKYRDLFENMTEEVHFWKLVRDQNGEIKTWRLVDANPPTLKTWGKTLEDIQGRTTDEIFGPGATEHYMPVVQKIMTEDIPFVFEDYFPNLDKYFRFASIPLGDYFITTGADITSIRKATEAVRESEQRLAGVLESMPDGFVSFDRELRYTHVNGNAERLQNARRENLLGRDVRAVYPDPESYKTISQYERVLDEHVPITSTSYHAGFDRWVEVRAFPTPDGVSVFYKDVSDLVKAEQALRESEERLRLLGDNLPDIAVYQYVHECDGSVRFVHISAGIERLNGVAVADVLRDAGTLHRQSSPEYMERLAEAEGRSKRELSDFDMELPMRRPDGEVRWMRLHSRPRRLPDGRTVWDGVQTDITETRRAEEQIKAALAEKEVLLKEIHHRVKNNMQVISSLVDLQADQLKDDAMRAVLQDVTHRVRSMALVHEKLYQSADMVRVEFAEYAQSLLGYLWRAHGTAASGIRLALDMEPVPLSVNAAVPCGLILNELATNALKHAFRGRDGGEVTVSLRRNPEGRVCLRVRDNGAGLPAGLDWRRADSLGLRLVQILAKQLCATVEVQSGAGTEFLVSFGGRTP